MKEYKVRIWKDGAYTMETIEGKLVTIPGFENYSFFIHRPVTRFGFHRTNQSESKSGWEITETTTGMSPGDARGKTQIECINRTQQILNTKGHEELKRAINYGQAH